MDTSDLADTPWSGRRLHFVGIGGVGMSGLALIAHRLGATVTGSDRVQTPYMTALRSLGIEPAIGYRDENVPAGAELVYSSAVGAENPERASGAPEMHRADLLAEITRLRRCIAVTGTHGKTTTSSMVVHALREAGMDPSYVIGGELRATGANAGWGTGEWLVVEADESDRSLLKLSAEIAVLTNAELDHHATYASLADLEATFARFMAAADHGVVWDRPALRALCPPGTEVFDAPDPRLGPDGSRFVWRGIDVHVAVPGAHNARNGAAALTAAALAGADPPRAAASLADFAGARRRMELLGHTPSGAAVYDDYAH
ncbi:MAG TPA: Mur ligase domain-containing protein, partial [Solirubrobacteraceae bacterium]